MNIEDIFTNGLHKLNHAQLIALANSQTVLLNDVSQRDLVYLIQELVARFEDLAEHRAQLLTTDSSAKEFNG